MKPFWWPTFCSAAFLSDIFWPLIATHGLGSKHLACNLVESNISSDKKGVPFSLAGVSAPS